MSRFYAWLSRQDWIPLACAVAMFLDALFAVFCAAVMVTVYKYGWAGAFLVMGFLAGKVSEAMWRER